MRTTSEQRSNYEQLEQSRAYQIFEKAIRSPETKKMYKFLVRQFLAYTNCKSYDAVLEYDTETLQKVLENYIMDLSDKGMKASTIKTKLAPIELFLDMNRKSYYKRVLRKLIPSDDRVSGGDVPFTSDEIRMMLIHTTKLRTKAIIHFVSSTGIRPGAIVDPVLRIKHLEEMPYNCYAIKVYDESKEGYWAFLTPEASKVLKTYHKARELNGEKLTDESPIFANYDDATHIKNQYLSKSSLRHILTNLMKQAGTERKKNGRRYDKAVTYGFRKRFNTILKLNNNVNSNIVEKLMAHKNGLDGTYLKPTREECFAEFVKAIPDLTLDESEKLKVENLEKEQKITELERMTEEAQNAEKEHKINETKIKTLEETTRQLSERLQKQESMTAEISKIHLKTKETMNRESDPSNPHYPDGGPFDTRLVNLEMEEINDKSMVVFDTEFEEEIEVVLRKGKVYCTLDKSSTCKHVLFALGNFDFYQLVKKHGFL